MFRKLLKYDFRSYFKSLLPIWGAILLLSVINGFTIPRMYLPEVEGLNAFITSVLPLMLFVTSFVIMGVMTLVLILQRFNQGLLGNEGYLMFTLPVSRTQLIGSKLFVSIVAQLISAVVVLLSLFIISLIMDFDSIFSFIPDAFRFMVDLFREKPNESWLGVLLLVELFVLALLSMAGNTLHLYAALSIGHLSQKHKVAAAVLAWVGFNTIFTISSVKLVSLTDVLLPDGLYLQTTQDILLFLLALIFAIALVDAIYWAVTEWVLRRKLNLE